MLDRLTGNPIVTVNRAVAVAMVDGAAARLTNSVPERRYLLERAAQLLDARKL